MRTKKELKKAHPELAELIDTLWPIAMMLFRERTAGEFTRSVISPDIETGFSAGLNNLIEGNNSGAVGEGLNTKSFLEILIGSYATIATDQDPEGWVATDRLLGIGNGSDDENRRMAMEIFKSGLIKLFNAIQIGDYAHGAIDPENGTLRYTSANGLEIRHGGVWVSVMANQKPIQVTGITLSVAGWDLVSGLYEYDLANSNITANSIVDAIPMNATIDIAIAAIVLPQTDSSAGSVKLYAKNEPTADIEITINIQEKSA